MTTEEALKNVELSLDDIYRYFENRLSETFERQEKLRKSKDPDDGSGVSYCEGAMDEQDEIMELIDIMKSKIHNEIIGYSFK